MILLLIIVGFLVFCNLCCSAAIDNKLDRIIDNQDIIKCIEKNKK